MEKIKELIEQYLREKKYDLVINSLFKINFEDIGLSDTHYICQKMDEISSSLSLLSIKIAFLSSFIIDPLIPFLKLKCYQAGLKAEVYVGGYNQYHQEILQEKSPLYRFDPEVVVLFLRIEEICPVLLDHFLQISPPKIEENINYILTTIRQLIFSFRKRSDAFLIIHNFEKPSYPAYGIIDVQEEYGQTSIFKRLNEEVVKITKDFKNVLVFDYDRLVSEHGKTNWYDPKLYFYAKVPFGAKSLMHLGNGYMRFLKPIKGLNKKCLVLDLDGVLWGGIVGEDGLKGIQLGDSYPGNIYKNFQKEILKLYHKGIILAINSKNNMDDVMEVFEKHPDMVLKKEHFASVRINWNDKVSNMQEIAEELNIGLDSMVFIDDSLVERELIRQRLPSVKVLEFPEYPSEYTRFLARMDDFEMLIYSEEDKKRGEFYRTRILTEKIRQSTTSLEDFYRSLQMKANIKLADPAVVPRLAQMTQRTNQFNLTTIRYEETDILKLMHSGNAKIYYLRLIDRFVDNGVVGEMIILDQNDHWHIDTFLLSCRVMNRSVETAFLSYVISEAKNSHVRYLIGKYIPTKKNLPVLNFYRDHGFELIETAKDGSTLWRIDIERSKIRCPEWITIMDEQSNYGNGR